MKLFTELFKVRFMRVWVMLAIELISLVVWLGLSLGGKVEYGVAGIMMLMPALLSFILVLQLVSDQVRLELTPAWRALPVSQTRFFMTSVLASLANAAIWAAVQGALALATIYRYTGEFVGTAWLTRANLWQALTVGLGIASVFTAIPLFIQLMNLVAGRVSKRFTQMIQLIFVFAFVLLVQFPGLQTIHWPAALVNWAPLGLTLLTLLTGGGYLLLAKRAPQIKR